VIDAIGGARLAQHPRAKMRFTAQVGANQLHRYDAIDEYVSGAINDTHPAFANSCFEAIAAGNDFAERRVIGFLGAWRRHCGLLLSRLCHVLSSNPERMNG